MQRNISARHHVHGSLSVCVRSISIYSPSVLFWVHSAVYLASFFLSFLFLSFSSLPIDTLIVLPFLISQPSPSIHSSPCILWNPVNWLAPPPLPYL
ncbi:hypothetical protein BDZ94DRAFT_1263267, partial [Collybia nuda]